jgi:SAM-dependent methyltransferase
MLELLEACGWGGADAGRGAGGVFYDLGCGSGKAVIAAALSGNLDGAFAFSRCAGVELLPSLVACAQTAVSRFQEKGNGGCLGLAGPLPEMLIWHGDVAACSLEAADVVFVSSVCFPDSLLSSIVRNAASMRKGSVLATLRLPASFEAEIAAAGLAIVSTCWVKMSWARVQVHILRKV